MHRIGIVKRNVNGCWAAHFEQLKLTLLNFNSFTKSFIAMPVLILSYNR